MQNFNETVSETKRLVKKMIAEQKEEHLVGVFAPSIIWKSVTSVLRYIQNLSAEDFKQIRYHCDLFTGSDLLKFFHPWPPIDIKTDKRALMYNLCCKGMPDSFCLSEPECEALPFTPGFRINDKIINGSIVRYQLCTTYLFLSGIAEEIINSPQKQAILEIGGGHGGLSHGLFHAFSQRTSGILLDLPEMLIFQIPFILINNPGAKYYIYDKETFTDGFIKNELLTYDFIFLPHFVLSRLKALKNIAIMLNVISFQEMTGEQVDTYLEFAKQSTKYGVYSDNYDCHPHNDSDMQSVTNRLQSKFILQPEAECFWDKISPRGVIENYSQFRRFIALNQNSLNKVDKDFAEKAINLEKEIRKIFT